MTGKIIFNLKEKEQNNKSKSDQVDNYKLIFKKIKKSKAMRTLK